MNAYGFNVNITTDQKDKMIAFYRDVVGLEREEGMGEGAFKVPGAALLIDSHSEIHGKAKEPARILINFMVSDLANEEQRLKDHGVEFIRERGKEEWGGVISTFLDPDGNYLQLIEFKGE